MRELRPGLWHWQTPHPDWTTGDAWPQQVSSYALDDRELLVLFDPLAVPDELLSLARERVTAIVLTAPWHERDTQALVEQLDVTLYAPRPDSAQDLMDKFGITAEQAGEGSPDLAWLRAGGSVEWYRPGDTLPLGVEAFTGREQNDLVLWVESVRAVVVGDTLPDFGSGLELNPRLHGARREEIAVGLRPLLDRPVELVLPAHGAPADRAALERALDPTAAS